MSHPRLLYTARVLLAFCFTSIALGLALYFPPPPPVYAASLTVTSLADNTTNGDGFCTLREAITAANNNANFNECTGTSYGADTITFHPSVSGTIVLSNTLGTLYITDTLTINGPGAPLLTISGNNAVGVMSVGGGGVILNLSNVKIAYGKTNNSDGAAIVNSGALNISNSTFYSNTASGVGSGGGIANVGALTITNSTLISNTGFFGGGVNNNGGTVNITGTTFYTNSASNSGGGIFNSNNGTMTMTNATFSGNSSTNGGGLYNDSTGTMNIANSGITSNNASSGGGIRNYGTLTVTTSTLSGNTGSSNGGGIHNSAGKATISNSTLSRNRQTITNNGGAGIRNDATLIITNTTFYSNTAVNSGGGLLNYGTVTMTQSTLANNSSSIGGGGGGIYSFFGSVTLRSTIIANSPVGGNCLGTTITSLGYNLDSGNTCAFAASGDLTDTNPMLGPIGNLGGPTQIAPLYIGSAAIDHIPNGTNGCGTDITTDQRGVVRPINSTCDIGAVEGAFYPLYLPLILK